MTRPIHARVDLAALRHNLAVARRCADGARILAVVKADAYGHGLLRTAPALGQADGFALLDLEEAARLRDKGYGHPIILLEGFFSPQEFPAIADLHLIPVIHEREQLLQLTQDWRHGPVDIYLKINTGMNRLGIPLDALPEFLAALRGIPQVRGITLMTHFACADEPRGIAIPLERFKAATAGLAYPTTLANSAALIRFPESRGTLVRPGIMLYGSSPFGDRSAAELGLRPALTLVSSIIAVRTLAAGDEVGYGALYRAVAPQRVGIVACGYADGYPRHAPTGTPVLIQGRRGKLLGRVSMDMVCVSLDEHPEAGLGTPVVLWGEGLPVDEVAAWAGTVGYELLTGLGQRVPRETLDGPP